MLVLTSTLECPTIAKINVVLLNTLIKLCTVVTKALASAFDFANSTEFQASGNSYSEIEGKFWTTVKTTSLRWEAEFMQQVLAAHEIPARIIDLGIESYMGQGSPTALQVQAEDEQLAIRLLTAVDETTEASE